MDRPSTTAGRLRTATAGDSVSIVRLWGLSFEEDGAQDQEPWRRHAQRWFAEHVDDSSTVRFPVIEIDGEIAATAIGTLELGVPNPQCVQGRSVRLANVFTVPQHRGVGHATTLVHDVIAWARSIEADRVDLSATPAGGRLYENLGFVRAKAPRMKLVL